MIDFNILSIVLGAIAMLIPIVSIVFHKKLQPVKWWSNLSILLSMTLCAAPITIQMWGVMYFVLIKEDFSTVIDTIRVLAYVCIMLLCIVVVLNVIYIIVHAKRD